MPAISFARVQRKRRRPVLGGKSLLGWLKFCLGLVWVRQSRAMRIRVPAELQHEVRSRVQRARTLLGLARASAEAEQQPLGARALEGFLGAIGYATDPSDSSAEGQVQAGAECVRSTLDANSQQHMLGALEDLGGLPQPKFRDLFELCAWCDCLIDSRSERERTFQRSLRWATGALVVFAAAHAAFGSRNLALHKTVSASSVCALTPPAKDGMAPLSRVVDGNYIEMSFAPGSQTGEVACLGGPCSGFAVCTNSQLHPWVTVDLRAEHT